MPDAAVHVERAGRAPNRVTCGRASRASGWRVIAVAVVAGLTLVGGCGSRTKEAMVEKARNVSTRVELEKALGRPDDVTKLGPVETWTYRASNGQVVFLIVGDSVTLQAAGGETKPGR
jgi:hypothetical protein